MTRRILTVFGTRPEAIKVAPVVLGLASTEGIESQVCVTAQHRQMLDQVLELFTIKPDYDLELMSPSKYSANPPLQSYLKIVRDTGGMILYKVGHDNLHPTSSGRHAPRSDWRARFQPFFPKHSPTDSSRTY